MTTSSTEMVAGSLLRTVTKTNKRSIISTSYWLHSPHSRARVVLNRATNELRHYDSHHTEPRNARFYVQTKHADVTVSYIKVTESDTGNVHIKDTVDKSIICELSMIDAQLLRLALDEFFGN